MKIDYSFKDPTLLKKALTHPSLCRDNKEQSYERLEFFGDKILSLVIAKLLWDNHPDASEADLSVMHSNLVNTKCLAEVASKIDLGSSIQMEAGEELNKGRTNAKILENAMEALIGAVYLDSDFNTITEFVSNLWADHLSDTSSTQQRDAKSILQEWAQKNGKPIPEYTVISELGNAHNPIFVIQVSVDGVEPVTAEGSSKKTAQQIAAKKLLKNITHE